MLQQRLLPICQNYWDCFRHSRGMFCYSNIIMRLVFPVLFRRFPDCDLDERLSVLSERTEANRVTPTDLWWGQTRWRLRVNWWDLALMGRHHRWNPSASLKVGQSKGYSNSEIHIRRDQASHQVKFSRRTDVCAAVLTWGMSISREQLSLPLSNK